MSSSELELLETHCLDNGFALKLGPRIVSVPFHEHIQYNRIDLFFLDLHDLHLEVCHDQIDDGINLFRSEREPLLREDRPNFVTAFGHDICYPVGDLRLHLLKFEELVHKILGFLGRGFGKLIGMFHAPLELVGHLLPGSDPL